MSRGEFYTLGGDVDCYCCGTRFHVPEYQIPVRFYCGHTCVCDSCCERAKQPIRVSVRRADGTWEETDYVTAFGAPVPWFVVRMAVQAERGPTVLKLVPVEVQG